MAQSRSVLNDLSHALALLESENDRLSDDNARLQEIVTNDELHMRKVLEENANLRELVEHLQPIDCEGNVLDIADTVSILRSEYDGDHEWDDVVVELALTKWGGDRWIVRGSKGEAWACDCLKTGYDEEAYEGSDDAEPIANPSLIEAENAKLRNEVDNLLDFEHLTSVAVAYAGCDECGEYKQTMLRLFAENTKLRELVRAAWKCIHTGASCSDCRLISGGCTLQSAMRELGVEQ